MVLSNRPILGIGCANMNNIPNIYQIRLALETALQHLETYEKEKNVFALKFVRRSANNAIEAVKNELVLITQKGNK